MVDGLPVTSATTLKIHAHVKELKAADFKVKELKDAFTLDGRCDKQDEEILRQAKALYDNVVAKQREVRPMHCILFHVILFCIRPTKVAKMVVRREVAKARRMESFPKVLRKAPREHLSQMRLHRATKERISSATIAENLAMSRRSAQRRRID